MNITDLQIGTKLELELFNSSGVKLVQTLISEFEWPIDENNAVIAAPIYEGILFPIRIGTVVKIYFINKNEYDISLFNFKARVIGRDTNGNLALLKIKIQGDFEKIQRRKYYRLGCTLPVQYRVVESPDTEIKEEIPYKKTIANNLSGGGICLLLEEKLEVGRMIECIIPTGQNKEIKFFGQIVRYEKRDIEGRYKFEAGIAYIKINNKDREAVVSYIFDEQRKLRKKGLI